MFQEDKILKFFQAKFASLFCWKIACIRKKMWKTSEILNQSPKLIAIIQFLLFDYSMLTIQIVEYYLEIENPTNMNTEYHYLVPTIQILE